MRYAVGYGMCPFSYGLACSDPRRVEQKAPKRMPVATMVSPITLFPRHIVESNAFFVLSRPAGGWFLGDVERSIPTNMVGQACERVRLLRFPRVACFDDLGDSL